MRRGFTLIELSIALVIIGLVLGGILVGRDLIKAAELRQAISDINKLRVSVNTFETQYDCLPGDCRDATRFFTLAAEDVWGNPPNGNGNGIYDGTGESSTRLWEHLSKAKLWHQELTGAFGTGGLLPGSNVASFDWLSSNSKKIDALYESRDFMMGIIDNHICAPDQEVGCEAWQPYIANNYTNLGVRRIYITGIYYGSGNRYMSTGPNCDFSKSLDDKLDDGMPNTGSVRVYSYFYSHCGGTHDFRNGVPPAADIYNINAPPYTSGLYINF